MNKSQNLFYNSKTNLIKTSLLIDNKKKTFFFWFFDILKLFKQNLFL